jgi:branched-chain amino acid transport system permease protein
LLFGGGRVQGVVTDLLQLVVSGLATGAIYALLAMGFALLWQTSSAINFAQGEFVMVPAFIMLAAMHVAGLPLWLAFIVALVAAMALLGVLFKRTIVDPILPQGTLTLAIATIGLAVTLKTAVKAGYTAEAQPFPPVFPTDPVRIAGVGFSLFDLGILATAGLCIAGLHVFLTHTLVGRQMQASAQNREAARVLGIDVERMTLLCFAINAALATVAALLVAPSYLAKFDMGETLGLYAFYAAIIGGFNRVMGALVGGLLVGIVSNLAGAYVSASYKDGFVLALLIAVILFRPEGLLGRAEERKV